MSLKRRLTPGLTLYRDQTFPICLSRKGSYRHEAVIGVGGNIGDVRRRFAHLFTYLRRLKGTQIQATGPILKNPPFGYVEQDDFYNTVIVLSTSMGPRALLGLMQRIEAKYGRRRSFANAPRTLDLDIIFFDDRVIDTPDLVIPHPHWQERQSVVIPLQGVVRCSKSLGKTR